MEGPSTEARKTRAGTGLKAPLGLGKSRCTFSIQVRMLKAILNISHFIFKRICGIGHHVRNEETSISALKFYPKWHILSVDTSCKWWSQDLNSTQLTIEPTPSLLCSTHGISVDKWEGTCPPSQVLPGVDSLLHPGPLYDLHRAMPHLILTTTYNYHYYPHFTTVETEAQRASDSVHGASRMWSRDQVLQHYVIFQN